MKLEYQPIGGAYSTLFDESVGDTSPTFDGSFKDKAEVAPGFGAAAVGITPNGNTNGTLNIPLTKIYLNPAAAAVDIVAKRGLLKGLRLNLKATVGATVFYWPGCVMESMTFKQSGQSVEYTFGFTTQDIQMAAP